MNGNIRFFDVNVRIGRSNNPKDSKVCDIEELIGHFGYYGIDNALIYHQEALRSSAEGNSLLLTELEGTGFYPCGVAVPTAGELGSPEHFVKTAISRGIKVFRLFPSVNNFTFAPFTLSGLLEQTGRYSMPVLVDFTDPKDPMLPYTTWDFSPDYRAVYETAVQFPDTPFVILIPGMLTHRDQLAILSAVPNVYLECSSFGYRYIEEVCGLISADRLIFGSHTPHLDPGLAISYVMYAEISDTEKQKIAGGNIQRLMGIEG
ncbi:MAG: amidohydrolase family protein [Spirochaetia bacterium]